MPSDAKRLKKIVREHEFCTYRELVLYVYNHCGERLRKAVVDGEFDLTRYIDARIVARERVSTYHKPSKFREPRLKCNR